MRKTYDTTKEGPLMFVGKAIGGEVGEGEGDEPEEGKEEEGEKSLDQKINKARARMKAHYRLMQEKLGEIIKYGNAYPSGYLRGARKLLESAASFKEALSGPRAGDASIASLYIYVEQDVKLFQRVYTEKAIAEARDTKARLETARLRNRYVQSLVNSSITDYKQLIQELAGKDYVMSNEFIETVNASTSKYRDFMKDIYAWQLTSLSDLERKYVPGNQDIDRDLTVWTPPKRSLFKKRIASKYRPHVDEALRKFGTAPEPKSGASENGVYKNSGSVYDPKSNKFKLKIEGDTLLRIHIFENRAGVEVTNATDGQGMAVLRVQAEPGAEAGFDDTGEFWTTTSPDVGTYYFRMEGRNVILERNSGGTAEPKEVAGTGAPDAEQPGSPETAEPSVVEYGTPGWDKLLQEAAERGKKLVDAGKAPADLTKFGKDYTGPVLVTATWCEVCPHVKPFIQLAASKDVPMIILASDTMYLGPKGNPQEFKGTYPCVLFFENGAIKTEGGAKNPMLALQKAGDGYNKEGSINGMEKFLNS